MGHGQRRQADEDHPASAPVRGRPDRQTTTAPAARNPELGRTLAEWAADLDAAAQKPNRKPCPPGETAREPIREPGGKGPHHEYDNSGGSQGNERGNACNYPAYRWLQNYPDSAGRTKQEYLKFRIAKSSGKNYFILS